MFIFFHAVQILNIKKPHFKQNAFRLFSLMTFSTVHRSILSAIKIVSANSKGINLKGLHSRCLRVDRSHSIWRLNYYLESDTDKTRVMPEHENVKLEFIQKDIFLYKTSYISVCSKTFSWCNVNNVNNVNKKKTSNVNKKNKQAESFKVLNQMKW